MPRPARVSKEGTTDDRAARRVTPRRPASSVPGSVRTCIYCQRAGPPCGFSREHVVPQALGKFRGDVVTLTEEVCAECNQHFGDTIDRLLTRDSAEAMFRFRYGLKDPAEIDEMFRRRLRVRLPRDGSKWGGAYLDLMIPPAGAKEPIVGLAPQLACERADGGGWEYFSEDDIRERGGEIREIVARDCKGPRILWAETEEVRQRLLALLAENGIRFERPKPVSEAVAAFSDGVVNAELEFTFDKAVARAVAKVGFNYLAKTYGADLCLRSEFDAVRRFIRHGEGRPSEFVNVRPGPVLRDSRGNVKAARGHLLTVGWDDDGRDVLARVCPFQHVTYMVCLSANFGGVWRPIESAHLYDLAAQRAERLAGVIRMHLPGSAVES